MSDTLTPYDSTHTGAEVDTAVDRANATWVTLSARIHDGSWVLAPGVDNGHVFGLGLNFVPVRGFLQIESPTAGFIIFANIVTGSFTFDGFAFQLSAQPDTSGIYKLHFILFGADPETGSSNSET